MSVLMELTSSTNETAVCLDKCDKTDLIAHHLRTFMLKKDKVSCSVVLHKTMDHGDYGLF